MTVMQTTDECGVEAKPGSAICVRPMTSDDAEAVLRIYKEGIDSGNATFTADLPSWQAWDDGHLPDARFVAIADGQVAGWVALAGISSRPVYKGVAEISIYVSKDCRRRGVGRTLLGKAVEASEAAGFWTLQAGIFPENEASLVLHADFGFVAIGKRRGLGRMTYGPLKGQWRDVVFMERRSEIVGVE